MLKPKSLEAKRFILPWTVRPPGEERAGYCRTEPDSGVPEPSFMGVFSEDSISSSVVAGPEADSPSAAWGADAEVSSFAGGTCEGAGSFACSPSAAWGAGAGGSPVFDREVG